jgi:general secretion pathway protein B
MSYILDALKKSEKERKRGKVPDVLTVQEQLSYERRKRNIWPYLIGIALLVNAGILLWWIGISPKKQMKTPEKAVTVQEATTGEGSSSENSLSSFKGNIKTTVSEETTTQEPLRENQSMPAKSNVRSPQERKIQKSETQKENIKPVQKNDSNNQTDMTKKLQMTDADLPPVQPGEAIPKPEPNKIYTYNELPEGVKKTLLPLSLSIALYSDDPATRIARIDGQTLREGQELKPGLKLEQIVEHGVILSYQNYRFRIGMK